MPFVIQPIDAGAGEEEHPVLHHMRLHEGQRRARIVGENVHRQVRAGRVGDERFQPRVRIAEKRRLLHLALVAGEKGGRGRGEAEGEELFFYVVAGAGKLNAQPLAAGGFGYVPPGDGYDFVSSAKGTRVLIFRKNYEPLDGAETPAFFTGHESKVKETPFLGDPHARLKTLIPDTPGADMAVNIFTYDPGATLPFVETHVMEHGMLFLTGSGVYRLDDEWHPVQAGDAIWIAPYCPQWFIAAGPSPARYIYYKDVNRIPL